MSGFEKAIDGFVDQMCDEGMYVDFRGYDPQNPEKKEKDIILIIQKAESCGIKTLGSFEKWFDAKSLGFGLRSKSIGGEYFISHSWHMKGSGGKAVSVKTFIRWIESLRERIQAEKAKYYLTEASHNIELALMSVHFAKHDQKVIDAFERMEKDFLQVASILNREFLTIPLSLENLLEKAIKLVKSKKDRG